ncbi:calpain-like cysteine peptidase [Trypanosoma rangeli]|uniref:Calpain-like cysteine peptidase n=1 Tax=Trypanosoma rangeli TaxID=5698 RepID=A0A422N8J0_TRYRA|nr:calpain-like cysteine peptidase [Trypanosoma rangeli]RNF01756.1 calpain-like cysteine peptidase [Trypanosoma rangeli]|eukprot:RNF01756.1 calpain-like cysteine peptidase [Trypanosoma rangeli]
MQKVDATLSRFDRKSPRAAYVQVCEEMGIRPQKSLGALLSDAPRDWDKHRVFDCNKFILGSKGCMALLPLLLCSRSLRRVSLRGCQVTDEFVAELAETLQDHQYIRSVDVGDNPLVTVYSADPIIKLLHVNKNVVRFDLDGTHIGANVSSLINDLCDRNHEEVANYYADDYFRMKNIFNYLDGDGSGWVLLRSLVLNTPFPVLQEQLIERISLRRPRKRSDGTISVDAFLELVYYNYKTDVEIAKRAKEEDTDYQNIITNWKCLLNAMEGDGAEALKEVRERRKSEAGEDDDDDEDFKNDDQVLEKLPVLPPADLYRLRIRSHKLGAAEAREIVEEAMRLQIDADARRSEGAAGEEAAGGNGNCDENSNGEGAANDGHRVVQLSIPCLRRAYRSVSQPEPRPDRFCFLQEHEEDYVPPMLRAGSRLISISKLSFLNSMDSSGGSVTSHDDDMGFDAEGTRTRWWDLPPAMVRLVTKFFNKQVSKLPKRRQSTLAISPRTQRDNAMQKNSIPVTALLAAKFVTDLESIHPRMLADKFMQYSIPIDVSMVTLQEIVNCLNEYYVELSVDKPITLEKMRCMSIPQPSVSRTSATTTKTDLSTTGELLVVSAGGAKRGAANGC